MSRRLAPYRDYRKTGVEWLTSVPSHWTKSTLGFECSVKARLGWKGLKAEEYRESGFIFLATPNIKTRDIDFQDVNYITKQRYDESPEIMLKEGDILVTKDGSTTGTTALVRNLPAPATVNSSIAVLRPAGKLSSPYLFYFFTSEYVQNVITRMRGGMGVPHLFQADLRKFFVVVPSMEEQIGIARFLDYETARIDALIEKQQQLIALLKEKRQAVISHAVTKGLNPNAPLRDSGVEWLGMVPAHWSETPLKAFLSLKHGYAFDGNAFTDSGEFMLMTPGNFIEEGGFREKVPEKFYARQDFPRSFILEKGQLLVAMTEQGPGLLGCALIVPDTGRYLHNQRLGLVCGLNEERLNPRFLFHLFNSARYRAEVSNSATGVKVRHTSPGRMLSVKVGLPPVAEQKQIAGFIDGQLAAIESMNVKADQIVSCLQERRTALISAAVTGKIDVRTWTPPDSTTQEQDVA